MAKMKRKHTFESPYHATIRGVTVQTKGRTKREAVKRMRRAFLEKGIPTMPVIDGLPKDLLDGIVVSGKRT